MYIRQNKQKCQIAPCKDKTWPQYVYPQHSRNLGSMDGTEVRALLSHRCVLGLIPTRYHMWVDFVDGSHSAPRVFFPGSPVLPPSQNPTSPNSNSTRIENPHENQLRLMRLPLLILSEFIRLLGW